MIQMIKTIDYKNVKLTDKEIQDFCKKMGYVTDKDLNKVDTHKKSKQIQSLCRVCKEQPLYHNPMPASYSLGFIFHNHGDQI